ncbi:DUF6946 family protein [Bradyrhizobium sp. CCBAU 51627]|uniref:DUF6946 family protein n=1 Tax=Bradyrhizobium sp. CCBAU 51627 TaxID=1325088 RepID=UPI003FA45166
MASSPDRPRKHWRIGFSARRLCTAGKPQKDCCSPEIARLFGSDAELLLAIPEDKFSLRDAGRESQTAVFALIRPKSVQPAL